MYQDVCTATIHTYLLVPSICTLEVSCAFVNHIEPLPRHGLSNRVILSPILTAAATVTPDESCWPGSTLSGPCLAPIETCSHRPAEWHVHRQFGRLANSLVWRGVVVIGRRRWLSGRWSESLSWPGCRRSSLSRHLVGSCST